MSYIEFLEWLENHPLTGGDGSDKIELLALVGIAWFENALQARPGLTLDDVRAAMFDGKHIGGH